MWWNMSHSHGAYFHHRILRRDSQQDEIRHRVKQNIKNTFFWIWDSHDEISKTEIMETDRKPSPFYLCKPFSCNICPVILIMRSFTGVEDDFFNGRADLLTSHEENKEDWSLLSDMRCIQNGLTRKTESVHWSATIKHKSERLSSCQ